MIYSFSRPNLTAVSAPAGGSVLTDISRWTNSLPRSRNQCKWTTGVQTTSTTMTLQFEWATAISPRVIALCGTDLPAGLPVGILVWNGSAFVAPSAPNNGTIVQRPDGRLFAIVLSDGIAATTKVQVVMTNNVSGTVMAADQVFTVGEFWIADAIDLPIDAWGRAWDDSTKYIWSFDKQGRPRKGVAGEVFKFTPWRIDQDDVYGSDSDPTALDWDMVTGSMFGGQSVLCIPRYNDLTGAYSNRLTCRSACFGFATQISGYDHATGAWFAPGSVKITAPAIY